MSRRIALIEGHPDPQGGHFCTALAAAYARGADSAGHQVDRIKVAALDFPLLRQKAEWDQGEPPPAIESAQHLIKAADHLVIIYPLWMGSMPALLKGFFEQVFRPGFAISRTEGPGMWEQLLKGRSARIVVTMGMPAFFYRWFYRAHSLKALERNMLSLCGIGPIRASVIGLVESENSTRRERWLRRIEKMGEQAK
ncbi:MAG: NAD(P)H-dependent oxidoreductase [Gammaproteobacteria bacterium]|jgi:putative NADPH-quinone reductase